MREPADVGIEELGTPRPSDRAAKPAMAMPPPSVIHQNPARRYQRHLCQVLGIARCAAGIASDRRRAPAAWPLTGELLQALREVSI